MKQGNKIGAFLWCYALLMCMPVVFCISHLAAQPQSDSISLMRRYMQISGGYKKLPLTMAMRMQTSANVMLNAGDTATSDAEFYLYKEGAYIKMGDVVQVAGDSLMVFIRNKIKTMSLYSSKGKVAGMLSNFQDTVLTDSAIKKMGAEYAVAELPVPAGKQDMGSLALTSRAVVSGTALPAQSIKLVYNRQSGLPLQAIHVERRLLKIDSAAYEGFANNSLYAGKILNGPGHSHYLLREKTITYTYNGITFDNAKPLPLKLEDCVIKGADGRYVPTKNYASYTFKQSL